MVAVGPTWAITVDAGRYSFSDLEEARVKAMRLSRRWGGAAVRIRRWDSNLSEPIGDEEYVQASGRETVEEYLQREAITRCPPGHGFTPRPV